jgi:hypothetical protein
MWDFGDRKSTTAEQETPEASEEESQTSGVRFSNQGAIPAVAQSGDGERPTASQLAFSDDGTGLLGGLGQFVGGTMFNAAGATMQAKAPPAQVPATDPGDRQYEDHNRLSEGKLVPAPFQGQTFTANNVLGSDGKVHFRFDRASVGEFLPTGTGKPQRGMHVSIGISSEGLPPMISNLRTIQVARDTKEEAGEIVTGTPNADFRAERAGWNDPKSKSRGWRVDQNEGLGNPHWSAGDREAGSDGPTARLRDAPASIGGTSVGKEFRTCAVAEVQGRTVVLACVDWGYFVDRVGNVSPHPKEPSAYAGAKPELYDSIDRWNKIKGNDKVDLIKPPHQDEEHVSRRERG